MAQAAPTHHAAADGEIVVPDAHDIEVRSVTTADLMDALRLGYEDFRAKPSYMLVLGLIYPLGAAVAAGVALGANVLPLVFPIAAGLALLGPIAAILLYEISRRREKGLDFGWGDMSDVLERASSLSILLLTAGLFTVFGLWLVVAQSIFNATMGYASYLEPVEFIRRVLTTSEGWTLILVGNAVGFLFAAAVLATYVVSFPMLLDRDVGAPAAVATSLRVTMKSPITIAIWGFIIALLMAAGTAFFLIGLGVIVPVLGHASWRLYRMAVAAPA